MRPVPFFYRFTRSQQRGILALFILIIICQSAYFIIMSGDWRSEVVKSTEEKQWLALQFEVDALKAKQSVKKDTIYSFNPNFISDYKGYTLGMSTAEIDRLHAFRKAGKFVNSAADFRQVTKVSDSLLFKISPYFKFPDWVADKQRQRTTPFRDQAAYPDSKQSDVLISKATLTDINEALEEDLDKVYGIGPAFAKKILRRRAQLGAFVSMEQMNEFAEFSPEALQGLKKSFAVIVAPKVEKLNINTASLNQLSYFPYFNKSLARGIITRRSMNGRIIKIEELLEIKDFPVDKVKIIALYLEF